MILKGLRLGAYNITYYLIIANSYQKDSDAANGYQLSLGEFFLQCVRLWGPGDMQHSPHNHLQSTETCCTVCKKKALSSGTPVGM